MLKTTEKKVAKLQVILNIFYNKIRFIVLSGWTWQDYVELIKWSKVSLL